MPAAEPLASADRSSAGGGAEGPVSLEADAGMAVGIGAAAIADAAGAAIGVEAAGANAGAETGVSTDAASGTHAGTLAAPRQGIQRSGSSASASEPASTSRVAQNTGRR